MPSTARVPWMTRNRLLKLDFASPPRPIQHASALVVVASHHLRRLIATQLCRAGYQVGEARDGSEGIDRVRRCHPNIVVIDSMLPDVSGIDFCRTLRQDPGGSDPYVLLLLDEEDEHQLFEAFEAGLDDYVTRPFRPWSLFSRLAAGERILRLQTT